MRNDVKLGLAVGGLLLGVVLAYALFFSNNSGDRQKDAIASGDFGVVQNGGNAEAPRQGGSAVETITDLNPPGHVANDAGSGSQEMTQAPEPATEATADAGTNGNATVLTGRSWTELLNSGGNLGPVLPPRENVIAGTGSAVGTNTLPPVQDTSTIVAPPATSGPRRYIIKQGDSFWTIARAEYGNAGYFAHIVRANPQVDPGKLKPGMAIVLPDKTEVIAAAAPRQDLVATSASASEQVLDQSTQYKVRSGDNLSTIAKKLYGRYDKWVSIYEMNREVIGPNPGILKNGMILRLPEPPVRVAGSL